MRPEGQGDIRGINFLSGLIIIGFQSDQCCRECCSRQAVCLRGLWWLRWELHCGCEPAAWGGEWRREAQSSLGSRSNDRGVQGAGSPVPVPCHREATAPMVAAAFAGALHAGAVCMEQQQSLQRR